jgi:hypothetical protein
MKQQSLSQVLKGTKPGAQTNRSSLGNLADIDGVLIAVGVEGEKRVGNSIFNGEFKSLLPCKGANIREVRAPPPLAGRLSQALVRARVVQVLCFLQCLKLARGFVDRSIVNGAPPWTDEAQISEVDAA